MRKQQLIIPFLLIPIISLFFLSGILPSVDAQNHITKAGITCGPETELNADETQCIPSCSEGTEFETETESCVVPPDDSLFSESLMLMLGIVIAAVATGFGLILTWRDRQNAANQRKEELVQTYSNELREISNQELGLKTKQECALYAEQYLDTVEKISTLHKLDVFDKNIMTYFENNFTYAIDLWNWYNYNVHGIDYDTQDEIWNISEKDSLEEAGFLKECGISQPPENDAKNIYHQ